MSSPCSNGRCGILVVDDDEVLASTLAKLLRQHYAMRAYSPLGHRSGRCPGARD